MNAARKVKVSVSLDASLMRVVDRTASDQGATRSAVMERWLREASRRAKIARLEEETAAYYDSMTDDEKAEDASWASASGRAARKLRLEDPAPTAATKSPRRAKSRRRP